MKKIQSRIHGRNKLGKREETSQSKEVYLCRHQRGVVWRGLDTQIMLAGKGARNLGALVNVTMGRGGAVKLGRGW